MRKLKRQEQTVEITLQQVWNEYRARKRLKPSTLKGYQNTLNRCFSDWLDVPVDMLTKARICDRHTEISSKTPAMANLAMRLLRALFSFAGIHWDELRDLAILNPVKILTAYDAWNPVRPRSRTILPHEMPVWFAAVRGMRRATISDYLLTVLLTGLRRQEAASLRWDEVDLRNRSLVVRDTKNGHRHEIPICDQLVTILERRRRQDPTAIWLFPGDRAGKPISNWSQAQKRVTEASGVQFTVHDLRRTFGTVAHSLQIPHETIKRLLNHSLGDVTARHYIHPSVEPLREPVQRIADEIYRQAQLDRPCDNALPYWQWPEIPPHQMPAWFAEVQMLPATVRDYLMLSLFLGLRRTDAIRLRWEDVNLQNRTVTIRESKNGAEYDLPLADQVLAILNLRRDGRSRWIFPSDFHCGHISGVSAPQWDLRATFVAVADDLGVKSQDIRGMLGQFGCTRNRGRSRLGQIIDATRSIDALRRPMQRIADELLREVDLQILAK